MDIKKLQRAIVDGLEDVKAQHISVFNTEHLSALFERVIIASGTSNRQTKALAASVRDIVRKRDMQVLSVEGEDNGEWIIVDCGAAVVHIMQPAIREYYHLEEIWGGKNVRVKVGEVNTKLVKASEPDVEIKPKLLKKKAAPKKMVEEKAANKSAAFKRVVGRGPARKTAAGQATAPARKAVSGGAAPASAPRKTAAKKAPAVKTMVVNAPVRKKAPAGKTVLKKSSPRKTTRPG
jgi:ribosome-associated protein